MEMPIEVDFQGMQGTPEIRRNVTAHIAKLEEIFGRIVSCRVDIRAPTRHHQSGAPYHVHIRLGLPDGIEVNVGRPESADEREADFHFALNQAFKRARRALRDRVRRMRGEVKRHRVRNAAPPNEPASKIGERV